MVNLNNLFTFINSKGLTAKKISIDTGISTGNISDWKSGRSMPTASKLVTLADYLDCSIDFLVGRTNDPTWYKPSENTKEAVKASIHIIEKPKKSKQPKPPKIKLPLYPQSASAGTGNYLFDADPEYIDVEKNSKTVEADFLVRVSGDSMLPKFHDGDIVLVKQTPSLFEGEIGIFYVDGDSFIKQMGSGELISINPNYPNISIMECDSIHYFGQVIGVLDV